MSDTITNRHKCETVYVIGKGPSLINFNWSVLDGATVIALNSAIRFVPKAYWLFMDVAYICGQKELWDEFEGKEIFAYDREGWRFADIELRQLEKITLFKPVYGDLLDRSWCGKLYYANTSMSLALNLAYIMGAQEIELLGFDLGTVPGCEEFSIDATDQPMSASKQALIFHDMKRMLSMLKGKVKVSVRIRYNGFGRPMFNHALEHLSSDLLRVKNISAI